MNRRVSPVLVLTLAVTCWSCASNEPSHAPRSEPRRIEITGGSRGAIAAGLVIANANLVVLCGLVGLWILMPWGSTREVGVIYFVRALPIFVAVMIAVGVVGGWAGARAATRRAQRRPAAPQA